MERATVRICVEHNDIQYSAEHCLTGSEQGEECKFVVGYLIPKEEYDFLINIVNSR